MNTSEKTYFYSAIDCGCRILHTNCPKDYYWDAANGGCRCTPQECGPNQYWDPSENTESENPDGCRCRCSSQVCPENYVFNNV